MNVIGTLTMTVDLSVWKTTLDYDVSPFDHLVLFRQIHQRTQFRFINVKTSINTFIKTPSPQQLESAFNLLP